MAKLYFRYGTVGSAKTLNLLAVAHNYQQQNKRVVLFKPALDVRFGQDLIRSRSGLEKQADLLLNADSVIPPHVAEGCQCILVDESQFLSAFVVEQLRRIATDLSVPVICYGLRTDFRGKLFEGSKRLLELSDSVEEVKTTCAFCNRKAMFNLKVQGGIPTLGGPTIDLGAEEKYLPACSTCYKGKLSDNAPEGSYWPGS